MRNTFRKTGPESAFEMFEAEADGLNELRAAGEIRVPEVIDCGVLNGQAFLLSHVFILLETGRCRLGLQ